MPTRSQAIDYLHLASHATHPRTPAPTACDTHDTPKSYASARQRQSRDNAHHRPHPPSVATSRPAATPRCHSTLPHPATARRELIGSSSDSASGASALPGVPRTILCGGSDLPLHAAPWIVPQRRGGAFGPPRLCGKTDRRDYDHGRQGSAHSCVAAAPRSLPLSVLRALRPCSRTGRTRYPTQAAGRA